jgi:Rap1a immunity proteins
MRLICLLVPTALFWSTPSFSQGFLHGNDLYRFCTMPDNTQGKATCAAFIIGAVDAFTGTHDICLPKDVIGKQVMDIVINYLRSHPETQNDTAASEINVALERFHCANSNLSAR